MHTYFRLGCCVAGLLIATGAVAATKNGTLPLYPNGHNMNRGMPDAPGGMGVPMVLETADPVSKVDAWYASNAPKSCVRTAASGGIKYACPRGSIVIYNKGTTQIAFVPAMPSFMGH